MLLLKNYLKKKMSYTRYVEKQGAASGEHLKQLKGSRNKGMFLKELGCWALVSEKEKR